MFCVKKILSYSIAFGFAFISLGLAQLIVVKAAGAQGRNAAVHSTRFDDWFYRCADMKTATGKVVSQCEVSQIAQVNEGDKSVNVLTLAIAKTASNAAGKSSLLLTALVPLNVILPAGLGFSVGGSNFATIAYRNCNEAGCWAQLKLDQKMLSLFNRNPDAQAHLRLMNGQNVDLTFSLKGLNKALAELQKPAKA